MDVTTPESGLLHCRAIGWISCDASALVNTAFGSTHYGASVSVGPTTAM